MTRTTLLKVVDALLSSRPNLQSLYVLADGRWPTADSRVKPYVRRARSRGVPANHPPLRPVEFEILLTLAEGDRHGYAIIQETEARSGVLLETGTLYRALRRLGSVGLVKPTARRAVSRGPDDERRRYYAITALGRSVAAAEAARLARLVDAARHAHLIPDSA